MALALPANATCDIYRNGQAPPGNSPAVANVPISLQPKGQSTLTTPDYTHVGYVDKGTDVRDGYVPGSFTIGSGDTIYVPAGAGTSAVPYAVLLVRRFGRGTSVDCKQLILDRLSTTSVPWPTNDV